MTQTLAKLPPSQRPQFARLQASIRAAYHANMSARRRAEFQAHLVATQPGGSLMPHARTDPSGSAARSERFERFQRFVHSWCNMGMPGTKPFFEGLWAILRLMVVPENLGGAGSKRIEWEVDDAVFMESAYVVSPKHICAFQTHLSDFICLFFAVMFYRGKDFMLEAIDLLKGVRIPDQYCFAFMSDRRFIFFSFLFGFVCPRSGTWVSRKTSRIPFSVVSVL